MTNPRRPLAQTLLATAGLFVLGAGTGLAFAGWIDDGARIFMTMAETGMAWCF